MIFKYVEQHEHIITRGDMDGLSAFYSKLNRRYEFKVTE